MPISFKIIPELYLLPHNSYKLTLKSIDTTQVIFILNNINYIIMRGLVKTSAYNKMTDFIISFYCS